MCPFNTTTTKKCLRWCACPVRLQLPCLLVASSSLPWLSVVRLSSAFSSWSSIQLANLHRSSGWCHSIRGARWVSLGGRISRAQEGINRGGDGASSWPAQVSWKKTWLSAVPDQTWECQESGQCREGVDSITLYRERTAVPHYSVAQHVQHQLCV